MDCEWPGSDFLQGQDFSVLHKVQTGSGAHQWVLKALFLRIKQKGREANHSFPYNVEAKNGGAIPPLPHM
jgi:hypothetical protein